MLGLSEVSTPGLPGGDQYGSPVLGGDKYGSSILGGDKYGSPVLALWFSMCGLLTLMSPITHRGPPRRPPPHILDQVKALNQSLRLGHLLCRSRNPDFLLHIIQRQVGPALRMVEGATGQEDRVCQDALCPCMLLVHRHHGWFRCTLTAAGCHLPYRGHT